MYKDDGFTLIELLVTLSVAAILLSVAIPSWTTLVKNNRLTGQVNDFVGALILARSEALKRKTPVVIRKTGTGWEMGWNMFSDVNRNNVLNAGTGACIAGEDCVIAKGTLLSYGNTLKATNFTNYIRYKTIGFSNNNGTFTFCDDRGSSYARAIIISKTGRPRISDKKSDGSALDCS
jgi:type IV fimbrial biogenesis protein FimT